MSENAAGQARPAGGLRTPDFPVVSASTAWLAACRPASVRRGLIVCGAAMVLALTLVGCGGSDAGSAGGDASPRGDTPNTDRGNEAGDDNTNPGGGEAPAPDPAAVLVGEWYALSQDGVDLPEDALVFTYRADGTGTVVEERSSSKEYTWAYDPEEKKLHIETTNEDLHFTAVLVGDTLSLVSIDPPMNLAMHRRTPAPAPGNGDAE